MGPFAIDTNILIYAHHPGYSEHKTVRPFLEEQLNQGLPFYLSWQVFYEYLRLTTHHKIHKKPLKPREALEDLGQYLDHPGCTMLQEGDKHLETLRGLLKKIPSAKSNFLHDCHFAAVLKEHGVKTIISADADFLKFDFLNVINPLAA